jgi:hypothetical protein
MILTEKVKIKLNSRTIKRYNELGYDGNINDIVEVNISDLSSYSHAIVIRKCNICGEEKEMRYCDCKNNDICNACAKYKRDKTNLERFGHKSNLGNIDQREKIKKIMIERYGVEHPAQNIDIMNKISETNFERYGCKAPTQNKDVLKKRENVYLEKYGFITNLMCNETKEKIKITNIERYGFENVSQNKKIKNKKIQTCLINYGVENPLQSEEIFKQQQKSANKLKKYKDITYRGTYEFDFLKNFYDVIKIKNAKSIEYVYDDRNKKYHPDFYLSDFNLIVEIKSSYTYDCEKEQNEAKKEAAINNGYNFIFIIDKNYSEFLTKISF